MIEDVGGCQIACQNLKSMQMRSGWVEGEALSHTLME